MKLKVALLDDSAQFCKLNHMMAEKLNAGGKHLLDLYTFTTAPAFNMGVDRTFDLVVIDWHLATGDPDGWEVARETIERFPECVVIMQSCDRSMRDEIDSLVAKEELTCATVYKKFLRLRKDRPHNILEICLVNGEFEVAE